MTAVISILSILLTGLFLSVLIYLIWGWQSLKSPEIETVKFSTKVTILIAARNEEERIHFTIEDLLKQDYPKNLTEIIIVDDHSSDKTSEIIKSYASEGVQLLQLNEDKPLNSYKKKAIAEAIKLSKGELMVATDADCRMGHKWLSTIVAYYEQQDKIMISSPVTYFEEKSLFEHMQTLEFYSLIGTGGAFIGNGHASTCNGANLAYRKDIFYEVGGFTGIDDLASGDDELLLQKVAARFPGKIGFLKHFDAVVFTHAKHTLKEFILQRRRWASKSVKYKDKTVVALVVGMWLFNVSVLLNCCLAFFDLYFLKLFVMQYAIIFICELFLLWPISVFFKRKLLIVLLPICIPPYILYLVYIGLIGTSNTYTWKGRVVR